MNNKLFRILVLFISVCITAVTTLLAVSFGLSNSGLSNKNDELTNENENLTDEKDKLTDENQELNKIVGNLQDTLDNLDEHAAIATYMVDGAVWRIQIVQKDKEFELPVMEETATQVYNGWKKNGTGDAVQTTSISEHTEFVLDMVNKDWVKVNWFGLNNFDADNVWTDGTDYYYSDGTYHFKKDAANNAWEQVTWSGLTDFDGKYIWNYNGSTYYSSVSIDYTNSVVTIKSENHFVLDRNSRTWVKKDWVGGPCGGGDVVIINGIPYAGGYGHPYYFGYYHHSIRLNGEVWEEVENDTWKHIGGLYVWTDGTNYYNNVSNMCQILDKNTNVWDDIAWYDFDGQTLKPQYGNTIGGSDVWTDGTNMYYSSGTRQAVIDTENHCLVEKSWIGMPENLYGNKIWTDGENIYYSKGAEQYMFVKN